jgi:hypothetical protein
VLGATTVLALTSCGAARRAVLAGTTGGRATAGPNETDASTTSEMTAEFGLATSSRGGGARLLSQYQRFEAMVSLKPECLTWAPVGVVDTTLAVPTGIENGAPLYSCRFEVIHPMTTGKHIGRWSGVPGEPCAVQAFGAPASNVFEVFVRTQ